MLQDPDDIKNKAKREALSDKDLFNEAFRNPNWAPIRTEIKRRAKIAGSETPYDFIVSSATAKPKPVVKPKLKEELEGYHDDKDWGFSNMGGKLHKHYEFCSIDGGVLNKTEDQLSKGQKNYLDLIRDAHRRFYASKKGQRILAARKGGA